MSIKRTILISLVLYLVFGNSAYTLGITYIQLSNNTSIDVVSNPHDRRSESFCEDIYNTINALVPFTTTLCAPAKGATKGSLTLLVMSPKQITGQESWKFWITMSVATVGAIMRKQHDRVIVDELILIDQELAGQNRGFALPISTAKNLQKKFEAKTINFDQFYEAIVEAGKYKSVNK